VRDVEQNERKAMSFGSVLAMMAALLCGAAILMLIAANWEAFPRLLRVAVLFAAILGGYVGGAVLKTRGYAATGEALYLIAAAAFGASIALIGQMYHMSGDEAAALATWCVGTGIAALALQSNPLTIAAAALASAWLALRGLDYLPSSSAPHLFIVLAALLWLVSFWTGSKPARHMILLSVVFYVALLAADGGDDVVAIASLLAAGSAALFAAAVLQPQRVERIAGLDGRFVVHCLIGFLVGIGMIEIQLMDETWSMALLAVIAFAGIAAAIVLAGRDSHGLRWIAYGGFSLELAFVYTVTLGTMLGTAGLFFASGIVLGLVALLIIRIEGASRLNKRARESRHGPATGSLSQPSSWGSPRSPSSSGTSRGARRSCATVARSC
jgi:uncharacterized membrane protein